MVIHFAFSTISIIFALVKSCFTNFIFIMKSISKLHSIVIYDNKDIFYSSIPLYGSMSVDTINNIIDALLHVMPPSFSLRLE